MSTQSPIIEQIERALDYIEREKRTLVAETRVMDRPGIGLETLITRFAEVRDLHARLKGITTGVNQLAEFLSYELVPLAMERTGFTTVNHEVGRVSVATRTSASILPEHRERAFGWLRDNGLGDLIIETVNAQTLGATAAGLIQAGGELPDDIFKTTVKTYTSITKPGANRKAPRDAHEG